MPHMKPLNWVLLHSFFLFLFFFMIIILYFFSYPFICKNNPYHAKYWIWKW